MKKTNKGDIETFGKYILLERLAAGGMAEVYLAKSPGAGGIEKYVALKRILPQYSDNEDFINMFKEEAKIAVNLNHSNIVSIFDFGIEKKQFFLVMEYVEGQNLRQVLNHLKKEVKEFSLDQIVYVIKEVAAGLDHAHRCLDGTTGRPLNITHRDMSPQNIMLSFDGEIKIVDFGIAKAETHTEQTRVGTIKGKFGYMSPEQAEGLPVDLRTDIFSLGIVLWELLSKERLFSAQNETATLKKIRDCQIPSLRKINPSVSPELERIINKSLIKDKNFRYQTAASFHRDLNRFLNTQFPEFSPHDFSVFMKSSYSVMYLENRKKLSEYSKVKVKDKEKSKYSEKEDGTQVTETMTMTETKSETSSERDRDENKSSSDSSDPVEGNVVNNFPTVAQRTNKVDMSQLKTSDKPVTRKVFETRPSATSTWGHQVSTQGGATQSRVYNAPPEKEGHSFIITLFLVFSILAGMTFYTNWHRLTPVLNAWMQKSNVQNKDEGSEINKKEWSSQAGQTGQTAQPGQNRKTVIINIHSNPNGATVYIDDRPVGVTPYFDKIDSSKGFKLRLTKEGYQKFENQIEKVPPEGFNLKQTLLPEIQIGYLNLEIVNGGRDPVIVINGRRLAKNEATDKLQLPANVAAKIQVTNPQLNLYGEESVIVGPYQKKYLKLELKIK